MYKVEHANFKLGLDLIPMLTMEEREKLEMYCPLHPSEYDAINKKMQAENGMELEDAWDIGMVMGLYIVNSRGHWLHIRYC